MSTPRKLQDNAVASIRRLYASGATLEGLATHFQISKSLASQIIANRAYHNPQYMSPHLKEILQLTMRTHYASIGFPNIDDDAIKTSIASLLNDKAS
jgi:hypothetical protein